MVKILIIRWIIMHCDRGTFIGMRWEDRKNGIFSLYWKHQSSRSCKEKTAESEALYEYYRAWARHKNNKRRRQPRDLKAAFRNALEKKKPEVERLTDLDTKERIYWKINDFPNGPSKSFEPVQPAAKKSKVRGRKPKNFVQDRAKFNLVNYGASTSTEGEEVFPEQKKPKKPSRKESRKNCVEAQEYLAHEEVVNGFLGSHEMASNQFQLPSIETFKRNPANGHWEDSLTNTAQPSHFLDKPYEKLNAEDFWTPQIFPQTPPPQSSDLLGVPSTEMMEPFYQNETINYSFQPTPPQETADIIQLTDADVVTIEKLIREEGPKYSFPFQPEEVSNSQPQLTNTPPPTSLHCSHSDFASPMKTSNVQSNNYVLNSGTTPQTQNAFVFDQRQFSSDQVVPPFHEAFQTNREQEYRVSGMLANDCLLYSPRPVANHSQNLEVMCLQQTNTFYHSCELLRYDNQTSYDDSGISDMEDFLDTANLLLDNIDLSCD